MIVKMIEKKGETVITVEGKSIREEEKKKRQG